MEKGKYPYGGLWSRKVDWSGPNAKLIQVVQDESIYKSYVAQKKAWLLNDQHIIRKKGEGKGIMASGFLTEVSGMLQLSAEELNDINCMRAAKGKHIFVL